MPNYTTSSFSLDIISHLPQFSGKSLKKYYVDGINTVGAWGNEPFEVRFTNHTSQKVQVRISIDGTDVFTGKPATTDPSGDMWVVNAYGTMSLKAWPENNNGGAAFVFTSANNSVAIHTHGDLSSRGIIAAAVFTEGYISPIWQSPIIINNTTPYVYPTWYNCTSNNTGDLSGGTFGMSYNSASYNSNTQQGCVNYCDTSDSCTIGEAMPAAASDNRRAKRCTTPKSLESLAAVGAGQHVDQKITYVSGLVQPTFAETVRVRYLWWDDLVATLRHNNVPSPHPDGFPGDRDKHTHINLGGTPRLPTHGTFSRGCIRRTSEPVYDRV